jgi:hypothetical protein
MAEVAGWVGLAQPSPPIGNDGFSVGQTLLITG